MAGQRVMPSWVRGRMNAFLIMLGQGGMAFGAILWATGVANVGLDFTFAGASLLALIVLALGLRFSINFAAEAHVDEAPLDYAHDLEVVPGHDEGPITITIDYFIANDDREQFRVLIQEVQTAFRRNGAFQCRVDESLDQSGMFRLEYQVSTWAEHLRHRMRMTVDETDVYKKAWSLHVGKRNRWSGIFDRLRNDASAGLWRVWPHVREHIENAETKNDGRCLQA